MTERITCKYPLYINSLKTIEGETIWNLPRLIEYLCSRDCTVSYESMEEAVAKCAMELCCVYRDIYELEEDIHRFYI